MMRLVTPSTEDEFSKLASVLEAVRSEKPDYWPYGLHTAMFAPGDLFAIKSAGETVGFVGWQERQMGGQQVGLYSIGVLPSYRNQGVAKQAVAQLIEKRAARVDRVVALVVPGNLPSTELARSLGIPRITKKAGLADKALQKLVSSKWILPTAGAYGTTVLHDRIMHSGDNSFARSLLPVHDDEPRNLINLVNAALGAIGGSYGRKMLRGNMKAVTPAIASMAVAPATKDLVMRTHGAIDAVKKVPGKMDAMAASSGLPKVEGVPTWALLAGSGLLTAGLGAGAYALQKALRDKAEAPINITTQQGGRLRVTLPTENPGDAETVIDLPYNQETALSNALRNRLTLDTRRRLYAETKARVKRRGSPATVYNVR